MPEAMSKHYQKKEAAAASSRWQLGIKIAKKIMCLNNSSRTAPQQQK
jgi:hypothetical protein